MFDRMARLAGSLLLCGLMGASALASDKPLRIGTLAPKNSLYHRQLLEIGEAWRQAQGGNAKYVVFPDGSQGGEAELARRMRIGQLQGALLSIVGLSEIEPSINALQSIPLLFKTWEEVPDNQVYDNGFKAQWEDFIRHVVADAPWRFGLMEGVKGVQLAELGLKSWAERRWLNVPDLVA